MIKAVTGNKKKINIAYMVMFLLTGLFIFFNSNYSYCWFDEYYSLHIITHSYAEIWDITAVDVHPPLYYWILKFLTSIFGTSFVTAHILSSVPLLLTLLLTRFNISRLWGHRAAILFYTITLLHAATIYMASDIRMYGWASFFVLATFVYGWQYLQTKKTSSLVFLTLVAACAAYTHYYALLGIFFVYLFLIGYSFCAGTRKESLMMLVSSLAALILYSPWLLNMASQVATVSDDYWISDISYVEMARVVNMFGRHLVVGAFITLAFVLYTTYNVWKQDDGSKLSTPFWLILLSFMPSIAGILISYLLRPVFIPRYIFCTILLLFLGMALLMAYQDWKKTLNRVMIVLFLVGMGYVTIVAVGEKYERNTNRDKGQVAIKAAIDELQIADSDSTAFIYHYHFIHEEFPLWALIYPNAHHVCKTAKLKDRLQLLEMIPHEQIGSYETLPEKYKTLLFVSSNYYPFMGSRNDSLTIAKYYEINRVLDVEGRSLYRLSRKEMESK